MKLATFQSYIVKNPPPGFGGRYFIFVTLTTSCGITGTGEIYAASFAPEIISRHGKRYISAVSGRSKPVSDRTILSARMDPDFRIGQTHHFKALSVD